MIEESQLRQQLGEANPTFCKIMKALLIKNTLIILANKMRYLLIYFSPLFVLLIVLGLQKWTQANILWQRLDTPAYQVPPIPHCYGDKCVTIAYAINGQQQPYINQTMEYLKRKNNLTDQDVVKWDLNYEQIISRLKQTANQTQAVVVFCTTGYWNINNFPVPCFAEQHHMNAYTIIFNLTLNHRTSLLSNYKGSAPKDMVTVRLKKDLDEGILRYYSKIYTNMEPQLNITVTQFPSKNARFISGVSIFAQYGSFFVTIPYLILMVMEGSQKLKQKQDRLRIGLNLVGVSHFQFYLSELLVYLASVIIISVNFCVFGYIIGFSIWANGIIWFDMLILVGNGFTIGLISFCITAFVQNKNLGMSFIYTFILYSIVMQWLFSGGFILQLLYMQTASSIVKTLKLIFNLYPSFHFSKIFSDMVNIADSHFNTLQNRFMEGRRLQYDDLFHQRSQTYEKPFPHSYTIPSAFESFTYMCLTTILYLICLWLLDRYIQSNRGYTEPICKMFGKRRKNSLYTGTDMQEGQNKTMVRITNLQKIYNNQVHALKGVSMELNTGQIVSLLGQNGAGKSTLINILIGALSLTKGQIVVDQMNIETQITEIRKIIGVCPQFDILWEQMTAQQHIRLFSALKGYSKIDQIVNSSLSSVNLYENRNGMVSTFSGGMKRRLSLAISLIGNPKLIVLDEPTTGMDAKIRQQTWKIILSLRDSSRTILITTHNMEQSQCLSDKIFIMNKGRIVAEGSTVQLKNQFGTGYTISGIDPETDEQISFTCKQDELQTAMLSIKQKKLKRWELKGTSLQEVFLNVVARF